MTKLRAPSLVLVLALGAGCPGAKVEGAPGAASAATPPSVTAAASASATAASATAPSAPASATPSAASSAARPARWAEPVARPGLPNLHRVDEGFYRGAQPTAEGIPELVKLGVRTVVNVRALHSDRSLLAGHSLDYEHISFKAWHPERSDVVAFLRIATDRARQPFFLHCQHGADRTGMMTAIYRITVQGWSKDDAIAEMVEGGFGFHAVWQNLVAYVRELDVASIAREAGLAYDAGAR
ncbi:MAG: tyrosine-protein phosphatase [Myxococcales bacterium]|nr:tyrosine-protein phosphatase [Myxococcales bacterium]